MMLLEKMLALSLHLYTRPEYKFYRNRDTRDINFKDSSDLAYVRVQFKRYLFKNRDTLKFILLVDTYNAAVKLDVNNYNFNLLEDRQKIIDIIDSWINSTNPNVIKFI